MAVEIVYRSSRDPEQLFMETAEEVSLYLAQNRDVFAKAFKSNLGALADLLPSAAPS